MATTETSRPEQTNLPDDHGGPCPEDTSQETMASDMPAVSWGYVMNPTINRSVKKPKENIRFLNKKQGIKQNPKKQDEKCIQKLTFFNRKHRCNAAINRIASFC